MKHDSKSNEQFSSFKHLMERSWFALTETCLAFTVFRDDFSPKFVTMFLILFFLKAFHWLIEDRVDYVIYLLYKTATLIFCVSLVDAKYPHLDSL
jgi:hypothetical protein